MVRLRKAGRFVVRPEKTITSPRRYVENGAARRVLRNWKVIAGYFAGVSPETLTRWYGVRPPADLRLLRQSMRDRMRASPLLDGKSFARDFENALFM